MVERVARAYKVDWQVWASAQLDREPDAPNLTAVIRNAAILQLMLSAIQPPDNFEPNPELHPMLGEVNFVNRELFLDELHNAITVYEADFGGFVLHAGYRQEGGPALFIENKMIDQLSVILTKEIE